MRVPGTHISSLLEISVIRVCRVEAVGYLVAVEEAVAVGVGVGWVGAVGEDFVVVAQAVVVCVELPLVVAPPPPKPG